MNRKLNTANLMFFAIFLAACSIGANSSLAQEASGKRESGGAEKSSEEVKEDKSDDNPESDNARREAQGVIREVQAHIQSKKPLSELDEKLKGQKESTLKIISEFLSDLWMNPDPHFGFVKAVIQEPNSSLSQLLSSHLGSNPPQERLESTGVARLILEATRHEKSLPFYRELGSTIETHCFASAFLEATQGEFERWVDLEHFSCLMLARDSKSAAASATNLIGSAQSILASDEVIDTKLRARLSARTISLLKRMTYLDFGSELKTWQSEFAAHSLERQLELMADAAREALERERAERQQIEAELVRQSLQKLDQIKNDLDALLPFLESSRLEIRTRALTLIEELFPGLEEAKLETVLQALSTRLMQPNQIADSFLKQVIAVMGRRASRALNHFAEALKSEGFPAPLRIEIFKAIRNPEGQAQGKGQALALVLNEFDRLRASPSSEMTVELIRCIGALVVSKDLSPEARSLLELLGARLSNVAEGVVSNQEKSTIVSTLKRMVYAAGVDATQLIPALLAYAVSGTEERSDAVSIIVRLNTNNPNEARAVFSKPETRRNLEALALSIPVSLDAYGSNDLELCLSAFQTLGSLDSGSSTNVRQHLRSLFEFSFTFTNSTSSNVPAEVLRARKASVTRIAVALIKTRSPDARLEELISLRPTDTDENETRPDVCAEVLLSMEQEGVALLESYLATFKEGESDFRQPLTILLAALRNPKSKPYEAILKPHLEALRTRYRARVSQLARILLEDTVSVDKFAPLELEVLAALSEFRNDRIQVVFAELDAAPKKHAGRTKLVELFTADLKSVPELSLEGVELSGEADPFKKGLAELKTRLEKVGVMPKN